MAKRPSNPSSDVGKTKAAAVGKKLSAEVVAPEPMKTRTLPDGQRGPWLEQPDVVTMLQIFGTAVEFALPANTKKFTLGSSHDCDISLRDPSISKLHCLLERRGSALRVYDQASYNGTFFDGRRETTFDLRPGNTFTASATRFLALNDEMRAAYPTLADILGSEDEQEVKPGTYTPSDLVLVATSGHHVLIVGEPGCDQERLARTLHAISLRRGRELVQLSEVPPDRASQREIIDRGSRSTLVVSIDEKTPVMDGTFASSLFSPSYQIRIVALAPTTSRAAAVLGGLNIPMMQVVMLRPVSMRVGAIPRLLDRLLVERNSPLRVSDMTAKNQAALQAYAWPDNLDGLRTAADRLAILASAPSLRKAAENLKLAPSSLHYWLDQLGLAAPLVEA